MKAITTGLIVLMGAAIFFAVLGAFFDALTAKEAVQVLGVLAVVAIPLTLLAKLLA